jgi:hypothetical protein
VTPYHAFLAPKKVRICLGKAGNAKVVKIKTNVEEEELDELANGMIDHPFTMTTM